MAFVETANFETKEAKGSGFLDILGGVASFAAPIVTGALTGGASSLLGSAMGGLFGKANEAVAKAYGGNIPQMTNYNGGGTHEQNPMGGIPVDQFGNPSLNASALVEQGEVGYKLPNDKSGYVFSNRIAVPGKKVTFADEAKKIASKYKNRLGKDFSKPDALAKKSLDMEMEALKNGQEEIKQMEQAQSMMQAMGGYLKKLEKGGDAANYLKGSGYKEAMLGYGIQGLTRLPQLFTSPESISYDRVNPELVDFAQERGSMETSRNAQLGFLKRQAGMAGNAGQALNYLASAVPSAYNQYDQQYAQSIEREQNTNAQIMNQANAQNAQIQMKEAEANAMERDAARSIRDQALGDIGNIGGKSLGLKSELMQKYYGLKAQGATGDYTVNFGPNGEAIPVRNRPEATPSTDPSITPSITPSGFTSVQAGQGYNPMLNSLGLNPNFGNTLTGANNPLMGKKLVPGLESLNFPKQQQQPVNQQTDDPNYNPLDDSWNQFACGGSLKKCKGGYIKKKGKK